MAGSVEGIVLMNNILHLLSPVRYDPKLYALHLLKTSNISHASAYFFEIVPTVDVVHTCNQSALCVLCVNFLFEPRRGLKAVAFSLQELS